MSDSFDSVHMELDPLIEILALLFQCKHYEQSKEHILKELQDLGLDAPKFYNQYMRAYETYVTEFAKHHVTIPEYDYLLDLGDSDIAILITTLLVDSRDYLSQIETIKDEDIIKEILVISKELFSSSEALPDDYSLTTVISFLETLKISEQDKWQFIRLVQRPKFILSALISMIEMNKDAFYLAKNAVETELAELLHHYHTLDLDKNTKNYPIFALPLSYLMFEKCSYNGLLVHLIMGKQSNQLSKEELLKGLKALSDKSKFDILCSLKVKPKYNLEIAEVLGLTAATMSHHMGVLLANQFVEVEKQDGKVYYHINQDNIKGFINALERTFL